ncbi:MAG: hypothetical protein JW876_05855 [Candidatus Krumholzibacteriota bacterium]|nr:hypothetical protein [Candidatus Krumholzibacteriota bacterium]
MRSTLRMVTAILFCLLLAACSTSAPPTREEDGPAPDPIDLVYPPDGATGQSLEPFFYWTCDDEPSGDDWDYVLYIANADTMRWVGVQGTVTSPRQYDGILGYALEELTEYAWRVTIRSHDDDLLAESPVWTFTTGEGTNNPPLRPFDPDPETDATGIGEECQLTWSCEDPDGDPLVFDVWLGPTGSEALVGDGQAAFSHDASGLSAATEYSWWVVAHDDRGGATTGPQWRFTTSDDPGPFEGVFTILTLGRVILYDGQDVTRVDNISARFDSALAPCTPVTPLRPDAVSAGSFDLAWQESLNLYMYSDYIAGFFLNPGTEYVFDVTAGGGVPALVEHVTFPVCECYITSPAPGTFLPRTGFDLEWQTTCGGTVDIVIGDLNDVDSTGIYITTENDGSYTITSEDLAPLSPWTYQLQIIIVKQNRHQILATGFDPRSWIWARVLSTQYVFLNP